MVNDSTVKKEIIDSVNVCQHVAWPLSWIEQDVFLRYLNQRIKGHSDITQLCLDDLYLACACGKGIPEALHVFEENILKKIRGTISRYLDSTAAVDDFSQELRMHLLVANEGRPARITEYSGTGRLIAWARTTATRMLVDQKRKKGIFYSVSDEELFSRAIEPGKDPEVSYFHHENNQYLKAAISAAISQLSNEQHNLLRLHFVDGLNYARIALILGVHRSTVMREIHEIQADVRLATIAHIKQHARLQPAELESLMRSVDSQLGISLLRLLKASSK